MADITMPQLGETVTEGTITRWFKQVGDAVAEDEVLFEVSTDKVDSEVPSPVSGVLSEILVAEGDTVDVGTVLARLGDGGAAPAPAAEPEPASTTEAAATPEPEPAPAAAPPPAAAAPASPPPPPPPAEAGTSAGGGRLLSPVVRRLLAEYDLDAGSITGTGVGGRITRGDVEAAIAERGAAPVAQESSLPAPAPAPAAPSAPAPTAAPAAAPAPVAAGGDTVVPLNNIRRRTAEHMVMSKATSPHVLTAIEVDYENVERVRRAHGAAFKAEEGTSLTYLPFIAWALSDALREFPHLNASVGEGELIVHGTVNLAIAVDLNFEGLLAPVVKDVESLRLRAIAREISSMARRARSKDLGVDDVMGGTFTITNAGGYGTMMQFPIINQPQVAILSTDGIKRRPVVVTDEHGDESIAIHSTGVLALAWDHRAFDGAYAASFLNRLREIIETHDWESEL